jgi:adenine-specific DNA-methyltransferase
VDKNGTSLDIRAEKLKQLAQLFPEFVNAEGNIDITLLKYLLDKPEAALQSIEDNEKPTPYQLTWKGREKAFLKTLETTTKTLNPDRSNSIDFDSTENLLIEGENLQVLQTLQNAYQGKVKMIYIDPPYNTGNDFIYNDKFKENKRNYQKEAGIRNEDDEIAIDSLFKRNSKDNGNYHSDWLSMMYPRLFLARNLLREDGVIFVSIDDNEQANLKLLMNQIFGEENFVGQWNWFKSATPANLSKKIKKNIEYIFCYQKSSNTDKFKGVKKHSDADDPITKSQNTVKELTFKPNSLQISAQDGIVKAGIYGTDKFPNELLNDLIIKDNTNENTVTFKNKFVWTQSKLDTELDNQTRISLSKNLVISYKKANYDEEVPPNFISKEVGVDTTENGGREIQLLFNELDVFDYPKPISLIRYLMNFCCKPNDIIFDFFGGSGTTAHAVLEQNIEDGGNRKFICVQMPVKVELNSEAQKAGYNSIFDITKARIRKVVEKLKKENETKLFTTSQDLGFRTFRLANSNFRQWNGEVNNDKAVLQLEIDHNKISNIAESPIEFMLYEILLKEGHLLTEKVEIKQAGEGNFYYLPTVNLCVILEGWGLDMRNRVVDLQPKKVIILDSLFENDDQFMSNTAIYLESFGIDLEIV